MATAIENARSTEPPTYPHVPVRYRVAVAVTTVLVLVGVSILNPPFWLGALVTGGIMVAVVGILQAVLRWRWRVANKR